MVLIIGGWGSRGRRVHATYLFFYYTFVSSVVVILALILLLFNFGVVTFYFLCFGVIGLDYICIFILLLLFVGFMAKIPCFPVHIWLPEAHVEAPSFWSVVLASVLLKLGFYGLVRSVLVVPGSVIFFCLKPLLKMVFLVSLLYCSVVAVCQVDLKKIVAYSSVVHMNFALMGFVATFVGFIGSIFLMMSHGLISGALFFLVGFLYDRFGTRNLLYFGGLLQHLPVFSVFFFIFVFSNMGLPGTSGFVGEFLVFISLVPSFHVVSILLISLIMSAVFCLLLLVRVVFFQLTAFFIYNLIDLRLFEFLILIVFMFYICYNFVKLYQYFLFSNRLPWGA